MSPERDSPESTTNAQGKQKRACDCCRKRKVRCDGEHPCGPCRKAAIRCAYLQPPKKKGPKGLRSARVLQALRKIDEAVPITPESPLSPGAAPGGDCSWSWSSASPPTTTTSGPVFEHTQYASIAPTTHAPIPAPYYTPFTHGYQPPPPNDASLWAMDTQFNTGAWLVQQPPQHHQALPSQSHTPKPFDTELAPIPNDRFYPYVHLFFTHLFPIMPIMSPHDFLNPALYDSSSCLSDETYALLCALCAATIVQLDDSIQRPQVSPLPGRPYSEASMFAKECLAVRRKMDYIRRPTSTSVMTSFFMFSYYGNNEQAEEAWYYLQEAITFSESLNLDDERIYSKARDQVDAQWRRRLYWLLFVTERAYAIQCRKHTRMSPDIQLPQILKSEDPRLLNGFVNLVTLFSAIDDNFVSIWRGARRRSLCSASWLASTQHNLDTVALIADDGSSNVTETQMLDISVSREWLHVLAWQMGVSNGLILGKGEGGMSLQYPVELARRVVGITEGASRLALDSHGIGMEQKLSDVAGCLADVLRASAGDTSEGFVAGRGYLHMLVNKLSLMRGKESRYLKPLMLRVSSLLDHGVPSSLSLPTDSTPASATTSSSATIIAPLYTPAGLTSNSSSTTSTNSSTASPNHHAALTVARVANGYDYELERRRHEEEARLHAMQQRALQLQVQQQQQQQQQQVQYAMYNDVWTQ